MDRNEVASLITASTSDPPSDSASISASGPSYKRFWARDRLRAGSGPASVSVSESESASGSGLETCSFTRDGVEVALPFLGDVRKIDLRGVGTAGFCCTSPSFRLFVGVSGKGRPSSSFNTPCIGWGTSGSGDFGRFFVGESLVGESFVGSTRFVGKRRVDVGVGLVGEAATFALEIISPLRVVHLSFKSVTIATNVLYDS